MKAVEEETNPKKKQQLEFELAAMDGKMRRRKFGNITFVFTSRHFTFILASLDKCSARNSCQPELLTGALWISSRRRKATKRMTRYATIQQMTVFQECVACAVQLLESIGPKLEANAAREKDKEQGGFTLDTVCAHLEQMKPKVSNRIR